MELEEVRRLAQEVQNKITNMLIEFHNVTGATIGSVDVRYETIYPMGAKPFRTLGSVTVDVKI